MDEADPSSDGPSRPRFLTPRYGALFGFFLLAIIIWIFVGSESRQITKDRFEAALVKQAIPKDAIQLRGNIVLKGFRIDRTPDENVEQERGDIKAFRSVCDAKCAALLALPEVESVSVITEGSREPLVTRFRLVDKAKCSRPSIFPQDPDALRSVLPDRAEGDRPDLDHEEKMQAGIVAGRSLADAWRIRLSEDECIVADRQLTPPDFTIESRFETRPAGYRNPEEWKWTFDQRPLTDHQLEIRDHNGVALMRRQFLSVPILARPIHPGSVATCGDLCFVFGWARTTLANFEPGEWNWQEETALLFEYTNLARGVELSALPGQAGTDLITASLRGALNDADRPANDPAFGLADSWIRSLNSANLTDADVELLIDLIEDDRVTAFQGMWHATRVLGRRVTELEDPIRQRLARDFERPEVVKPLAAQLVSVTEQASPEVLAEGPSEADLAILNDPEKRLHARGLIVRQSDYGVRSVPLLLKIMREHMERTRDARAQSPSARIPAEIGPIDAAMVAFCRLGPQGKSAVPEILVLHDSWLSRRFAEDLKWKFTLARIGVPLANIPKPDGLKNMSQADYQASLRRKLARFDANRDCRGSWS